MLRRAGLSDGGSVLRNVLYNFVRGKGMKNRYTITAIVEDDNTGQTDFDVDRLEFTVKELHTEVKRALTELYVTVESLKVEKV